MGVCFGLSDFTLLPAVADINLQLTLAKCAVYSPQGDCSGFPPQLLGRDERLHGLDVLGVPVGDPAFVIDALRAALEARTEVRLAAEDHDERIQSALAQLVPGPDLPPHAIRIASLPARMGGSGLTRAAAAGPSSIFGLRRSVVGGKLPAPAPFGNGSA
eukprot:jgi/Mesvir1/22004/Mv14784-RA.1